MAIARRRGLAAAVLAATAAMPAAAAAAPGWIPYPGLPPAEIDGRAALDAVEIARDGTARVRGVIQPADEVGSPRAIDVRYAPATGWGAVEDATGLGPAGPAARAHVTDGRVVVALRGPDGTYGPGQDIAPVGPVTLVGPRPTAAVSENGDAVVAWTRRGGPGGRERLVAATKVAGHAWSAPRVVAGPDFIGAVAVAVDLRGTAVVIWGQGRLARRGDPPRQRIHAAERRVGATGWSARSLGFGSGSGLALAADGAGTVHAIWGRSHGRAALMARRTPGAGWRRAGAVPETSGLLTGLRVSALGDIFVIDPFGTRGRGRVHHRPAGGTWSAFPAGDVAPFDAVGGISLDLDVNAAGDAVLGWSTPESNTQKPLRAAYHEAPARPALTSFVARRAGKRVVLDARLSAPGGVLVRVRRAGSPRILDGFIATVRRNRATIAVPARVGRVLARPGRYELVGDTGGRDRAASTRTAVLRTR